MGVTTDVSAANDGATTAESAMFPTLTPVEIECLSAHGERMRLAAGAPVFAEGEPADSLYVVLSGAIRITKRVGGADVVVTVHHPGEFTGELSLLTDGAVNIATGHAAADTEVLRVVAQALRQVLVSCPTLANRFISAMSRRVTEAEVMMQQREKLASLGTMAAGLAHELNNPASAARSAAGQLRKNLDRLQEAMLRLNRHRLTDDQLAELTRLRQHAAAQCASSVPLDPLEQSDREEALMGWLDARAVPDAYHLAATFVPAGLTADCLDALAGQFAGDALADVLAWLAAALTAAALVDETEQSATRMSDLVKAIKQYAFLDQAPLQEVDVHATLENTLLILHHKLKHGVTVVREYDRSIPRICAFGSELNQVWTNLVDNAVDAMNGRGRLTVRTVREGDRVLVEIVDDGPGVPEAVQARMFEPFFTTKGVGKGTGLGLSIAYKIVVKRHHGDVRVQSRPGETRFQVRLPVAGAVDQCPEASSPTGGVAKR